MTEKKGIDGKDIVVYGRSLGGAVASWLAESVKPGALVIESSFTSAPDMARRMFPYLPVGLLCRFKYDSLSRIGNVCCPVLVAHSPDDGSIPFSMGVKLFESAKQPKIFIKTSGGHNDGGLESDSGYQAEFSRFTDKL